MNIIDKKARKAARMQERLYQTVTVQTRIVTIEEFFPKEDKVTIRFSNLTAKNDFGGPLVVGKDGPVKFPYIAPAHGLGDFVRPDKGDAAELVFKGMQYKTGVVKPYSNTKLAGTTVGEKSQHGGEYVPIRSVLYVG